MLVMPPRLDKGPARLDEGAPSCTDVPRPVESGFAVEARLRGVPARGAAAAAALMRTPPPRAAAPAGAVGGGAEAEGGGRVGSGGRSVRYAHRP